MNDKSAKVSRYRKRLKQRLIVYKGGKCEKCGYDKPIPGAYHFHHREKESKSFNISGSTLGRKRLEKEVDKCDLLCANCHAEEHDKEWSDAREIDLITTWKCWNKDKVCLGCDKEFVAKRKEQKYCCRMCSPTMFKKKGNVV